MRGQNINDVAARLAAEVAEHHGDDAVVDAVLMAAYVQDEEGGEWKLYTREAPGEDRAGVAEDLRLWVDSLETPGTHTALGSPRPGPEGKER